MTSLVLGFVCFAVLAGYSVMWIVAGLTFLFPPERLHE